MKKIRHILDDSPFVTLWTAKQKNRFITIFPHIRDNLLCKDPLPGELESIYNLIALGNLAGVDPLSKLNLFSTPAEDRLQAVRRYVASTLREVSQKSSGGLPSGLVSDGLLVEFDREKQRWNIIGKSNHDHMFQLSYVADIIINDGRQKKWEIEGGQFTSGLNYINQLYPYLLMTSYLTEEENKKLPSIVTTIFNECKDQYTHQVDYGKFKDLLMNAEHYKRAGITFHSEIMNIKGKRVFPHLVPDSFTKLMGKKKVKKKKIQNRYW
jgi:hypothetical protein